MYCIGMLIPSVGVRVGWDVLFMYQKWSSLEGEIWVRWVGKTRLAGVQNTLMQIPQISFTVVSTWYGMHLIKLKEFHQAIVHYCNGCVLSCTG